MEIKGKSWCEASNDGRSKKKVPAKVLRYFPLKPRLQRLFLSSKTAEDMRWHSVDINSDGMMRHPRDSEAWKAFDSTNISFASDPRNVRLGLATDGFNPFGNLSTSYSIWPVILISYNTPPWVCMKPTSFILSTIIPGKKMPGNNIDVYMQPLIKELKELWHDGVDAYDASTREMFKVALKWNEIGQPIGEAGGLLGGALGSIAANFDDFSISYLRWPKVASTCKERVWNYPIKAKFDVNDGGHKKYIIKNIGKKWKDNRVRLFAEFYDETLSWEANLESRPDGMPREQ